MESIITTSGCSSCMAASMRSKFVSHKNSRSPFTSPMRFARSLICFKDSSPDMYKTFFSANARFLHTCKRRVDFPIPGSPPTKTRDPLTTPPPNTRSSSSYPVFIRSCSSSWISDSLAGFILMPVTPPDPVLEIPRFPEASAFATGSSTNVFHSRQPGHWPSHFADSNPHSLQKNAVVFPFAIGSSWSDKKSGSESLFKKSRTRISVTLLSSDRYLHWCSFIQFHTG